jgi:hypothetical protein
VHLTWLLEDQVEMEETASTVASPFVPSVAFESALTHRRDAAHSSDDDRRRRSASASAGALVSPAAAAAAALLPAGDPDLPFGWERRTAREGRVYYLDHNTQTTQWKHPLAGRATAAPASAHGGYASAHGGSASARGESTSAHGGSGASAASASAMTRSAETAAAAHLPSPSAKSKEDACREQLEIVKFQLRLRPGDPELCETFASLCQDMEHLDIDGEEAPTASPVVRVGADAGADVGDTVGEDVDAAAGDAPPPHDGDDGPWVWQSFGSSFDSSMDLGGARPRGGSM